jgi:abortive infection bacteriophage resistance protein
MKKKLSVDQQIEHLKEKGVKFQIVSEDEAKKILENNTYYFKLKAYLKSFNKNTNTGQYINVDFAHVYELSKLDAHLREAIKNLTLDIEHLLKVSLIHDITNNHLTDGYDFVKSFLADENYIYIEQGIIKKKNSACSDLIQKYTGKWPAWALVEVLSFGDFLKFYSYYYQFYNCSTKSTQNIIGLAYAVKFLRNAAAHNNCLLNSIRIPYRLAYQNKPQINAFITTNLLNLSSISPKSRKNNLSNPVIHDFIAAIILFDKLCLSQPLKNKHKKALEELLFQRFCRNKDFFEHDNKLYSSYLFVCTVVDFYIQNW